jgi:hypothetical protein
MNNEHHSITNGFNKVRAEPIESLDAVVLHDTLVTGKRGLSVLTRLTGILEDNFMEIRPRTWRIDLLQDPSAAEYATQDVSTAHLIVVSTSGQAPLPLTFKIWFTTILEQKQRDGENVAVVALLGLDELTAQAASHDFHFIKQQTLDAKLEFFAPHFDALYPVKSDSDTELVSSFVKKDALE